MSGVDIASCKIKAFTVASIFGTVAGAMYAHYMGYINPSTFNLDLSTNYVVMLMVGGLGSVVGTIFGSAIVTILPENFKLINFFSFKEIFDFACSGFFTVTAMNDIFADSQRVIAADRTRNRI